MILKRDARRFAAKGPFGKSSPHSARSRRENRGNGGCGQGIFPLLSGMGYKRRQESAVPGILSAAGAGCSAVFMKDGRKYFLDIPVS